VIAPVSKLSLSHDTDFRLKELAMTKSVQPIPPGHENLIPHLVCERCAAAIEFYKEAFGAEEVHRMPAPDGRRLMHAAIRIGNSFVFLVDDFPEYAGGKSSSPLVLKGTPVTIHHYVADCDAAIKRAKDAGAIVTMPPQDMFWGDRYGVVTDPFGHKWSFATHLKDLTPDQMRAAMKGP
jgi:PhnB protein